MNEGTIYSNVCGYHLPVSCLIFRPVTLHTNCWKRRLQSLSYTSNKSHQIVLLWRTFSWGWAKKSLNKKADIQKKLDSLLHIKNKEFGDWQVEWREKVKQKKNLLFNFWRRLHFILSLCYRVLYLEPPWSSS